MQTSAPSHQRLHASRHAFLPALRPSTRSSRRSYVTQASAALSESGIAQLEQLKRWLGSKNTATDKIAIGTNIKDGRPELVAAKDFNSGEAILQVADSAWLSQEAMKKHPLGRSVEALEPWLQAALVLVHERFGSSKSEWSTYVSTLPASPPSPAFWSEEHLEMIKGTQLLQSVTSYNAFFTSKFEELQQQLFSRNPAAFPPSVFTKANFLWAVVTVRSRLHAPLEGDQLALVPLADMVSHSRNSNVMWRGGSGGGLFNRGKALVVEATRAVRKGETLSMDYGPGKLDNELLLDYGVLDAANSKAGYSLCLTMPSEDRNLDDKLDVLELAGMGASTTFNLVANVPPSENMLAFLRLVQLQGADTFLLESVFRNDVWSHMVQPVSEGNEKALCLSMAQGAREALASYPSNIGDDLALLRSGKLAKGSVEETALLVRLGEMEALDSVLRFFEQREALLPTLEFYQERRLKRLGLMDDKGNTTYDGFFDKGIA